jgi:nicotinamidase-related amidase
MLDPKDTVFLLIDHQAGLMGYCGDIDVVHLRNNAIALAKTAKAFDCPVVLTAAAGGANGPIGPIIPEITSLFPDTPIVLRTTTNSWLDKDIRGAIAQTGRKQLVTAGITSDFCMGLPAIWAAAEGYDVRAVIDASGNPNQIATMTSIARLAQAGVTPCNWVAVCGELLGDWTHHVHAERVAAIYREHLPQWSMWDLAFASRPMPTAPALAAE